MTTTQEKLVGERTRTGRTYRPKVDIIEREHELVVLADMPGASPDSIDVRFEKGMLTISGTVEPRQPDGTRYLLREYGVGDFHRSFQLSEVVDTERISAECQQGVLMLHLPKVEAMQPRKIEVQAH